MNRGASYQPVAHFQPLMISDAFGNGSEGLSLSALGLDHDTLYSSRMIGTCWSPSAPLGPSPPPGCSRPFPKAAAANPPGGSATFAAHNPRRTRHQIGGHCVAPSGHFLSASSHFGPCSLRLRMLKLERYHSSMVGWFRGHPSGVDAAHVGL